MTRLSRLLVVLIAVGAFAAGLPHGATAAIGNAPVISQPSADAVVGSSTQAVFTGTASSYKCWFDGVELAPCSSPLILDNLSVGTHNFRVAGVFGGDPFPWQGDEATVSFVVVAPTASIAGGDGEDEFINALMKTWSISTDYPVASFECKLTAAGENGLSAGRPCTPPIDQPLPIEGIYTIQIRAIDPAGNTGPWTLRQVVADRTPPTIMFVTGPEDGSILVDTSPEFIFRSNEAVSFACSLNEAPYIPCNIPHPIGPLPLGTHKLSTIAVDKASNPSTPDTRSFTVVDKLPITISNLPDSDILNINSRKSRSARRIKTITGKARGGKITRVDIGVLHIRWHKSQSGRWSQKCRWMTSRGAFKPGSCRAKKWHKARGGAKFSYKLKRRLRKGSSYKFYSRARNSAGQIERHFSRRDKTRVPIRILRR